MADERIMPWVRAVRDRRQPRKHAVADDIIDQLSWFVTNETRMPAGLIVTVIDEIERLRAEVARKADYAERMDALAEERLIKCNMLRAVLDAIDALHAYIDALLADRQSGAWKEADRG